MISVTEADALVTQHLPPPLSELRSTEHAQGCILSEDIRADRDIPPYNRVVMDGIAISSKAWKQGVRTFPIIGTGQAGHPVGPLEDPEVNGLRIMTGAMLPEGADAVIPVENLEIENQTATVTVDSEVYPMRYIHPQGSDCAKAGVVLKQGTRLNATHIAIAVSVGRRELPVMKRPSVAVISNGDEIVEPGLPLAAHQIRPSNSHALQIDLLHRGFSEVQRFHYADDEAEIEKGLKENLEAFDVLILSGGVSMGEFDFIPRAMQKLKVKQAFHKVRQRPGKPLWFGVSDEGKPVFALPGNPVSTLTCYFRYVLPAIARHERIVEVELAEEIVFKPKMTYFCPVTLEGRAARPVAFNTSGDYLTMGSTDGFVECREDEAVFPVGTQLRCWKWD